MGNGEGRNPRMITTEDRESTEERKTDGKKDGFDRRVIRGAAEGTENLGMVVRTGEGSL
jgi:hypothetical protein